MPAVVRVKRRIDEEPLSAFVLNGKRRRLEQNATAGTNKEELSTVMKFAGTIEEQDDIATTHLARLSKEEAKGLVSQKLYKPANATDRFRQTVRQSQQEQRFRVVNCLRTTLDENNDNETSKVTIVDIEKQTTNSNSTDIPTSVSTNLYQPSTSSAAEASTALANVTSPNSSYVYDVYLQDNEQQENVVDLMDDNYLSVEPCEYLMHDEVYDNYDGDSDSEDSNHENHYANDYPDEEEGDDPYEDDPYEDDPDEDEENKHLREALEGFVLEDDCDENDCINFGSSTSEDEDFTNYSDPYRYSDEARRSLFDLSSDESDYGNCYIYTASNYYHYYPSDSE